MKRTTRHRALIPLLSLALATLASTTAIAQTKEEQAVRAQSDAWQRAFASRDVDRIMSFHTADAIVMPSNGPLVTTVADMRKGYGGMVGLPNLDLHWTPTKIEVVNPSRAIEYGTWTDSYDGPNGKVNDAGNYLTVWKKVKGQWKVAIDAPVSSMPLPTVAADMPDVQMAANTGVTWSDLSVPGFDPGAKIAVLHGNPGAKGDYTIRLQFPAGYRFPVHWHPGGEHLTVLSGTFLLAMGNAADWNVVKSYGPGDFMYLPARHAHFGGAQGVTVIQLHGEGPFEIKLGAPK